MEVNDKYLDHIQAIITRHNSNSFIIKGWAITICTGVLALAGSFKEPIIALIAIVPVIVFWFLDSFYLSNERCFISLYNASINNYILKVKNETLLRKHMKKSEDGKIDSEKEVEIKSSEYSLNILPFKIIARNHCLNVFKSKTIAGYYLTLAGFSILFFITLLLINNPVSNERFKVLTKSDINSLFILDDKPQVILNKIILNDSIIKADTVKTKRLCLEKLSSPTNTANPRIYVIK